MHEYVPCSAVCYDSRFFSVYGKDMEQILLCVTLLCIFRTDSSISLDIKYNQYLPEHIAAIHSDELMSERDATTWMIQAEAFRNTHNLFSYHTAAIVRVINLPSLDYSLRLYKPDNTLNVTAHWPNKCSFAVTFLS